MVPVSGCANDPDSHGEAQWARRHLLLVEKGLVIDAFHHEFLSKAVQE
jgi:hypothetical protein